MMMASASFEVETPTLCSECKKELSSQFIDGKVYVKPHKCKISQDNIESANSADAENNTPKATICHRCKGSGNDPVSISGEVSPCMTCDGTGKL